MSLAPEIQLFLQSLLLLIINAAVPVVTAYAVRWLLGKIAEGKTRLTTEQLFLVDMVVRMVVQSAEQSGLKGLIENTGRAKKEYALQRATEILAEQGLAQIDIRLIADTIEAKLNEGVHQGGLGAVSTEDSRTFASGIGQTTGIGKGTQLTTNLPPAVYAE